MEILLISLGCDKNLADTELMLGILRKKGFSFTDDEEEADIAIVNTCCFIGDAKEPRAAWLSATRRKSAGRFPRWTRWWARRP